MRLQQPLDDIFANRSHVRMLRALFELPDGFAVSAREAARRAGISHPRASASLRSLAEQGLLRIHRVPRANLCSVNASHVIIPILKQLFNREHRIPNELKAFLRQQIRRRLPYVSAAFLFGSAAHGNTTSSSDIDVALTCAGNKAHRAEQAMARIADVVQDRFGNRLNIVIGISPPADLRRPGRPGYRLWERISREGIALLTPDSKG